MNGEKNISDVEGGEDEEGTQINISQRIAAAIADTGCTVVYGGHGGALVPLVNAVVEHPRLKWVCARNEHDAATMAAAHAKLTGKMGCVIATSGPGATNLTTGILEATFDRVPLLAVTGMKPSSQIGYAEFQDANQTQLFAGAGIEWSKTATSAASVSPLLRDAVSTALTRRTCAHLAVPVDIQAAPNPAPLKLFCAADAASRIMPPSIDSNLLDRAAEEMVGTPEEKQPRVLIAVGLRGSYSKKHFCHEDRGKMSDMYLELAEALHAPIVTRLDGKGIVDETHPLALGVVGVHGKPGLEAATALIATSDLVLCIGVDDETLLVCNNAGLQIRKVIEVEPDAVVVSTRYKAEQTIIGDIETAVTELTNRVLILASKVRTKREILKARGVDTMSSVRNQRRVSSYLMRGSDDRIDGIAVTIENPNRIWDALHRGEWRKLLDLEYNLRYNCTKETANRFCHPASVLDAISILLEDTGLPESMRNATVCVDVGDVTLWASLCLTLRGGQRTLSSERLGTMGYALCGGVAAILAHEEPAAAIVLAGDSGFQMTLQELATFTQHSRPGDKLLVVVFDNEIMGRVAFGFDDAKGCEMAGPDYVALARAYGGDGARLDSDEDAAETVEKAMSADGIFLIHVIVDPEVKADMAAFHDNSLQVMNSG